MTQHVGHFSLWGDFELNQITAALELEPSSVYRKGDVLDGADCPSRVATWDFYCPPDSSLKEQVTFLLDLLWPRANVLRPLAKQFNAHMNLAGEGTEVLTLNPEALQKLVSLGVTLNCFYFEDGAEDAN